MAHSLVPLSQRTHGAREGCNSLPQSAALLRGRAGPSVPGWDTFPAGRGQGLFLHAVFRGTNTGLCQRPRWVLAVTGLPPRCWPVARAQGTPVSRLRDRRLRRLRSEIGIALLALWRDCPSSTGSGVAPRARWKVAEPAHIAAAARGLCGPVAALPSRAGPASGPVRATPEPGREPPGRGDPALPPAAAGPGPLPEGLAGTAARLSEALPGSCRGHRAEPQVR